MQVLGVPHSCWGPWAAMLGPARLQRPDSSSHNKRVGLGRTSQTGAEGSSNPRAGAADPLRITHLPGACRPLSRAEHLGLCRP